MAHLRSLESIERMAMLTVHTSPLDPPGSGDAAADRAFQRGRVVAGHVVAGEDEAGQCGCGVRPR